MKKTILLKSLLGIALSTGLFFQSCEDATDIEQNGTLNGKDAYKTMQEIQLGLNGVYASYAPDSGSNGEGDVIYFNAIFTDNVKKGESSNGQGSNYYSHLLQPGSQVPGTVWANRYATINYTNRILEAMETLEVSDSDLIDFNHIKGQLLGLRALAHLDLFMYFTPDYNDPDGLSVIYMDYVPEMTEQKERNTVSEVLAAISQDLSDAKDNLNDFAYYPNPIHYMRKDVINALEAKVALLEGRYGDAIDLADDLLAAYPLAEQADYYAMNNDETDGESIFTLSRTSNNSAVNDIFYFNGAGRNGLPYLEVSNQLYNLFDDADVRKATTINLSESVFNGENDPDNVLLINKYPGSGDGADINDIKLIRSAELLLLKAEAQARNTLLGDAKTTVLELRNKRGATSSIPDFDNLNIALTTILAESRLEFAFEGKRYLDLKRIGAEVGIGIVRESVDCQSFGTSSCSLTSGNYKFTMPIPTSEIRGNSVITQNPEY